VNHPLRAQEGIWVTPHIAGVARAPALAAEFVENWKRYHAGRPLQNVVDRERGY
jgi:glyoxylate/hydroxypyruvate reductase